MFQQLSENFEYVEELREKSHYQKIRNSMPDHLVNERFKKQLSESYDMQIGYTSLQGYLESRNSISKLTHNRAEDVLIFSGLNHARYLLTSVLCEKETNILQHNDQKCIGQCQINSELEIGIKSYSNFEELMQVLQNSNNIKVAFVQNPNLNDLSFFDEEKIMQILEAASSKGVCVVFEEPYYFMDRQDDSLPNYVKSSITDCLPKILAKNYENPVFILSCLENVLMVDNLSCAWIDLLNNSSNKFEYLKKAILDVSSYFQHPSTFLHPVIGKLFSSDELVVDWRKDLTVTWKQNQK